MNSFRTLVRKLLKFSLHKRKLTTETTVFPRKLYEICKVLKAQKRIISAETICGNTVIIVRISEL